MSKAEEGRRPGVGKRPGRQREGMAQQGRARLLNQEGGRPPDPRPTVGRGGGWLGHSHHEPVFSGFHSRKGSPPRGGITRPY